MSVRVLHISQVLSGGGAGRALLALTKYLGPTYEHFSLSLSPGKIGAEAEPLARQHGVHFVASSDVAHICELIKGADIVHVHWWNNPELDDLLRLELPPGRYIGWFHVGGHLAPQVIPEDVLDFFDVVVACSPHTFCSPAFMSARSKRPSNEVDMVYGAADLERVRGVTPVPHTGFNIGYIGTVDFLKMHRDFVALAAASNIPDASFIVCGSGAAEPTLRAEADSSTLGSRLNVMGYIEDLRPLLSRFDIYGYPLCPDNYSGSELNLQEVMSLGIPPVVFSYGGVSKLVVNDFTGIVVESPSEYPRALEYLYHHPSERLRLGQNAKHYAEQIFGAEHAARRFVTVYEALLTRPKRERRMASNRHVELSCTLGGGLADRAPGLVRFIASLGDEARPFLLSAGGGSFTEKIAADEEIRRVSPLLRDGTLLQYANYYSNEPMLRFWMGLTLLGAHRAREALQHLTLAWNQGMQERRLLWYITEASALANTGGLVL